MIDLAPAEGAALDRQHREQQPRLASGRQLDGVSVVLHPQAAQDEQPHHRAIVPVGLNESARQPMKTV